MKKIYDLLKEKFGYSSFRKGQEEIIKNILEGRDTLGIMPTGGGKSICYQIPALALDGITLVISPLISLMEDQVSALNDLDIPSVYINSSISHDEMRAIYFEIEQGFYKIVYIAPERLSNEDFRLAMEGIKISQIAVDEAHCISQWGHDFRRSYLDIPRFISNLKERPVVSAFTATATPQVKDDIVRNLNFNPNIFMNGFDRDNLKFTVVKGVNSLSYIKKYLKEHRNEGGIIYASTRKEVDAIYNELKERGYSVGRYHAGMSDIDRQRYQEEFIRDEITIMVATNAFGMGIDKSNVRFVIHNNIPKDMESYYQEAGRAGRDGLESHCILIFNPKDIRTQRFFIENNEFNTSQEIIDIKYEKLNGMVNYCHTSGCIRSYILEYFGDEGMENCGNCSNCLDDGEVEDITVEAQKIISCIGRTKQRFGSAMVVGILAGSRNQKILNWNLDKETTYGIMSSYSQKDIKAILELLIGDGYIEVEKGEFPTLKLTSKAMSFIKNKETLTRKINKIDVKVTYEGEGFFERLRDLRGKIAREEKLPAYIIFNDKTIREMSKYLPQSKEEMLEISGVGEAKYNKYGERFLEEIKAIRVEENPVGEEKKKVAKTGKKVKTHIISYELYKEGKSIEEIAKERELTANTVSTHLLKCMDEEMDIDLSNEVSEEVKAKIIEVYNSLGEVNGMKDIKEKLSGEVSYTDIKIVLHLMNNKTEEKESYLRIKSEN